jgi:DNA-binding IclR family transcriptional regulator
MGRNTDTSVTRILAILESFDGREPELSLADVARLTRMSKPSAHRFLQALRRARCVVQDSASRRYRMGPRIFELGMVFQRHLDVRRVALPAMHRLRDAFGETVVLSALLDDWLVVIDQVMSHFEIKLTQETGRRYAPIAGATGRVLLAFLPSVDQERVVAAHTAGLPAREHQRVRDRLAAVRHVGMDVSASERIAGALAIAGPLWGQREQPVAALSITGPVSRFTSEAFARVVPGLKRALDQVSAELGGAPASRRYSLQSFQRGGEAHASLMSAFRQITAGKLDPERS